MKYYKEKREIYLEKDLNNLDKFVFDFVNLLDDYVIVSGYVSIITGRSRATEDIDLLIPKMSLDEFYVLWKKICKKEFECINTENYEEAFDMLSEHAIRFSRKGKPVPNIEFKIMSNEVHDYSYNNRLRLFLKDKMFFISSIEMQIAYKVYLGSEKDLEDAKHLYELFKEDLDENELLNLLERFKVKDKFDEIK